MSCAGSQPKQQLNEAKTRIRHLSPETMVSEQIEGYASPSEGFPKKQLLEQIEGCAHPSVCSPKKELIVIIVELEGTSQRKRKKCFRRTVKKTPESIAVEHGDEAEITGSSEIANSRWCRKNTGH